MVLQKISSIFRPRQADLFQARHAGKGLVRKAISGFDPEGRGWRYVGLGLLGSLLIFGLAIAYAFFTPKSYTSDMTLIMPGAGAGSSINLSEIGQASSMTASPFSQASLSPTENYKRIITSRRVLGRAAANLDMKVEAFPDPSIKLVDQTQLMMIKLSGADPADAERYAAALLDAFLLELEELRRGEMAIREDVYQRHIAEFREGLTRTRTAILSTQSASGIVSIDQYRDIVGELEGLRAEVERQKAMLAEAVGRITTLASLLGIDEALAVQAFTIFTDPEAKELMNRLATERSDIAALSLRFGDNHPELRKAERTAASLIAALIERGRLLTGLGDDALVPLFQHAAAAERGALMRDLVETSARRGAIAARISELTWQIETAVLRVENLKPVAARLDDLERDHLIAEAVFSSALARIDTSKTDVFQSYPLVQVLEAPSLPTRPSAPMPKLALAGALAASILWTFMLVLLWIRLPVLRVILKTV
ncbi:GumC family protein [Parvularcula maris]|uniref:Wzz/FepE/Etk N-terminal domain-containing protein n=1 Tax=Parvularcula maris TaxID=2965077 RepID=A0A9X2L6H5_9PROT|nr:Wzz/FepE/Etk N-terminal domain-containing protein [Parvularcula maris]MCQ8183955.1 Wzz/FepE/Etk N-terminal domain-containing protein [Parvularcula maris]